MFDKFDQLLSLQILCLISISKLSFFTNIICLIFSMPWILYISVLCKLYSTRWQEYLFESLGFTQHTAQEQKRGEREWSLSEMHPGIQWAQEVIGNHHNTPASQMGQKALNTLICLILFIKMTLNIMFIVSLVLCTNICEITAIMI